MKPKTSKPSGPKTTAEARALPELTQAMKDTGGLIFGLPISGDDIMLFFDADGRAMRPVAWNGAWHKEEARL